MINVGFEALFSYIFRATLDDFVQRETRDVPIGPPERMAAALGMALNELTRS